MRSCRGGCTGIKGCCLAQMSRLCLYGWCPETDCIALLMDTSKQIRSLRCRRGDVHAGIEFRYLPLQHFSDIIGGLKDGLTSHNLTARFTIISEGVEADFGDMLSHHEGSVKLQLNQPVLTSWQAMVDADILVLSRSSFGYSAALYNEGLVLYSRFWHAPLPSWIVYHDRQQLQSAVAEQHVRVLLLRKLAFRSAL